LRNAISRRLISDFERRWPPETSNAALKYAEAGKTTLEPASRQEATQLVKNLGELFQAEKADPLEHQRRVHREDLCHLHA
jgi:hypothetical protein